MGTELVRELRAKGRVIEPLMDYHKDEVRELGMGLGLPKELVMRQPFPGPGLGVRLICAEKPFICDDFHETIKAVQPLPPELAHTSVTHSRKRGGLVQRQYTAVRRFR